MSLAPEKRWIKTCKYSPYYGTKTRFLGHPIFHAITCDGFRGAQTLMSGVVIAARVMYKQNSVNPQNRWNKLDRIIANCLIYSIVETGLQFFNHHMKTRLNGECLSSRFIRLFVCTAWIETIKKRQTFYVTFIRLFQNTFVTFHQLKLRGSRFTCDAKKIDKKTTFW